MRIQTWIYSALIASASVLVWGCGGGTEADTEPLGTSTELKVKIPWFAGNYVSEGYAERNNGSDWVAVNVYSVDDSLYHISIRSRADLKKPTCTFDADARMLNDSTLAVNDEGRNIHFFFSAEKLQIEPAPGTDPSALFYYCSGGAGLAGAYRRISEALDPKQIDPREFQKVLRMNDISFEISSVEEGVGQKLSVKPFGLQADNREISVEVDGKVSGAETGDLDQDGYPELFVYVDGEGNTRDVVGFSVNKGRSLSQIAIPQMKMKGGYQGFDEYTVEGPLLVRRYPLYTEGSAPERTGMVRQIPYRLKNGDASKMLVPDKVTEYPEK
ncbi:MAG: hypothetical protein IBJ09_07425 [Bacteroidia bacterium]|nr:hypothetical protein [Bacteroidia bacterium]